MKEAPHFSNVVTVALIVLVENGLTLMHMPRLLTNTEFRKQCLERVTDASIVEFFSGASPRSPSTTGRTDGDRWLYEIIDWQGSPPAVTKGDL